MPGWVVPREGLSLLREEGEEIAGEGLRGGGLDDGGYDGDVK